MSKRKAYVSSFNVSRNVKRNVSKALDDDLAQWNKASTPLGSCDRPSETSAEACNNNAVLVGDIGSEKAQNILAPSSLLEDCDGLEDGEETCEECETPDPLNLTFLNASQSGIDELETGSDFGPSITLNYDCDLCVRCKCGVCEGCFHTDGTTCQHCRFCVCDTDSGADSGSGESDDEYSDDSESIDLDRSDVISESELQNENIKSDFVDIVLKRSAPQVLVDDLLRFFRKHQFGNFPKSAKTLLKTPIVTEVRSVAPGAYWHRGIREDLLQHVKKTGESGVKVSFSIDGVPYAGSTGADFYPICCSFNDCKDIYLAGVYYGVGKPKDVDEFLRDFVNEMNDLVENGLDCDGKNVIVEVHIGVFDAVAKAMLLNVKGHGGYNSCTKCSVEGVRLDKRTAFLQFNCPLRTDESFSLQSDEDHHHGTTILTSLKTFKPVTNVPLDYMHLVLLGVFRKILYMLISGPLNVRQQSSVVIQISDALVAIAKWVPCEFARKSRSLLFVKRFKATEWRLLLLYVGIVVLHYLPKHLYEHFLVLHVAMTILASPVLLQENLSYAKELLEFFVKNYMVMYGKTYVSHNVHNLLHLADDCKVHGIVDSFSAFRYENFYQTLQKMIRKGDKPLQQLARRYGEQKRKCPKSKQIPAGHRFGGAHTNGPLPPSCVNPQYSYLLGVQQTTLKITEADNCCRMKDGSFVVIENFTYSKGDKSKVIVGRRFMIVESLYTIPCDSSIVGAQFVQKLSPLRCWPVESISYDYVIVNFPDGAILVQGGWISQNQKYAAFPPFAVKMSALEYDKFIQSKTIEPEHDWEVHPITIRAYSDNFSKLRLKLKKAEMCSDTDLNTCDETTTEKTEGPRNTRNSRTRKNVVDDSSSGDDDLGVVGISKIPLPNAPVKRVLTLKEYNTREVKFPSKQKESRDQGSPANSQQKHDTNHLKMKGEDSLDFESDVQSQPLIEDISLSEKKHTTKSKVVMKPTSDATPLPEKKHDPKLMNLKNPTSKPEVAVSLASQQSEKVVNIKTPKAAPKVQAMELAKQMGDTEFRAYVILNFSELRTQMNELTLQISKSRSKLSAAAVGGGSSGECLDNEADFSLLDDNNPLVGLPASNMEEWQKFSDRLMKDKKFARAVAFKIRDGCWGNATVGEYVRAAMKMVMQNSLASEFNWSGRQKQPFKSQIFVKLLKTVLEKFTKLKREKDDVKTAIQDWLRLSSQRFGGSNFKKWRETKPIQEPESTAKGKQGESSTATGKQGESSTAKGKQGEAERSRESSTPFSTPQKPKPTRRRIVTEASDDSFDMDEHIAGSDHDDDDDDDVIIENAEEVSFEKDEAEGDPHEFDEDD